MRFTILLVGILAIVGIGLVLPKRAWAVPETGADFASEIFHTERRNGLPENLLARQLWQESRFREDIIDGTVKSPAGAIGIAQIIPQYHPTIDPLDPIESIRYAGQFMRRLFERFGSWPMALAAYNWGEGNVNRALREHGSRWLTAAPRETQNYVSDILSDVPEAVA